MNIFVDIDETICFHDKDRHYPDATPSMENIFKINKLYDAGNKITYWTARGSSSGKDHLKGFVIRIDFFSRICQLN